MQARHAVGRDEEVDGSGAAAGAIGGLHIAPRAVRLRVEAALGVGLQLEACLQLLRRRMGDPAAEDERGSII
eukprot:3280137-Pyramimonas_sp.AAC.2